MSQTRPTNNPKRPAVHSGGVRRPVNPNARRIKKKKSKLPVILAFVAVIIIAVVAGVLIINNSKGGNTGGAQNTAAPTLPPSNGSSVFNEFINNQTDDQQDSVDKSLENSISVDNLSVYQGLDSNWFNVLLLGSDVRVLHETSRTDTMIICSINRTTGDVKLTSIMRDTAVTIPGHGLQRMNNAFFYGGPELTVKMVNELFNMNIEHYVLVDFNGFAKIAEIIGGINIDVAEAEVYHINYNVAGQYLNLINQGKIEYAQAEKECIGMILYDAGKDIHLNGMQTLAYARIRKLDSDFARAERQQKVLNKLMESAKGLGAYDIYKILNECSGYFKTNISINEIMSTASLVLNRQNFSQAQTMRVPAIGTYKEEKRNDVAMLYDMDIEANRVKLHSFIYQ